MPKWALSIMSYSSSFLTKGDLGPHRHLPTTQALLTKINTGKDPSMFAEYDALIKNRMWKLVPFLKGNNIVGCKWVYKTKYGVYG